MKPRKNFICFTPEDVTKARAEIAKTPFNPIQLPPRIVRIAKKDFTRTPKSERVGRDNEKIKGE